MTVGTVGRPYGYGGVTFTDTDATISSSGSTIMGGYLMNGNITPYGSSTRSIGSSSAKFGSVYAVNLYGNVSNDSSRTLKTNINAYDVNNCLEVIKNTEVVSYNYKTDKMDYSDVISELEKEKANYIDIAKESDTEINNELYELKLSTIDEQIESYKNEPLKKPETRYGFISEDAPWELVAMDRKSVDTYSAVAMCFGAIQVMLDKIEKLEEKVGV